MTEKIVKIISINPIPINVRGKISFGNWIVKYKTPSIFGGNGYTELDEYFWRKKEALAWIESNPKEKISKCHSSNIPFN
jgi:hypothetical protein